MRLNWENKDIQPPHNISSASVFSSFGGLLKKDPKILLEKENNMTLRSRKNQNPVDERELPVLASTSANVEEPSIYRMELMMLSFTHTSAVFPGRRTVLSL